MLLITRRDLEDAIAKCQGQKNPNASTCIKLAAYYTILDHTPADDSMYSYASKPSDSEFMRMIRRKKMDDVLLVIDDMMEELESIAPRLYYETMERLNER